MKRLLFLVWNLVLELSDEAAYARHLNSTGRSASAEEWKRFADSRYRRKYQNAKCC